jgi:hypothetical protein
MIVVNIFALQKRVIGSEKLIPVKVFPQASVIVLYRGSPEYTWPTR